MDAEDKTLNDELRIYAKKIFEEGVTEENCIDIINILQSIIESPFNDVYNDVNFCFLLTALHYVPFNSPLLELLRNNLRDKFLYFQYVKLDKENKDDEWIVIQEIEDHDDYKEIIQYNINQRTQEKIELGRTRIKDPGNVDINKIFKGFLSDDDINKELTEDEL